MGKLIAMIALVISTGVSAEIYPQQQKDAIRHFYTEEILNVRPTFVRLPSDVIAAKYAFKEYHTFDEPRYPPMQPMEAFRIFSGMDVALDDFFKLFSIAIGYDLVVHPDADLTSDLSINNAENKLDTIGEYLDLAIEQQVGIYRESKVVLVMPKNRIADTDIEE